MKKFIIFFTLCCCLVGFVKLKELNSYSEKNTQKNLTEVYDNETDDNIIKRINDKEKSVMMSEKDISKDQAIELCLNKLGEIDEETQNKVEIRVKYNLKCIIP